MYIKSYQGITLCIDMNKNNETNHQNFQFHVNSDDSHTQYRIKIQYLIWHLYYQI